MRVIRSADPRSVIFVSMYKRLFPVLNSTHLDKSNITSRQLLDSHLTRHVVSSTPFPTRADPTRGRWWTLHWRPLQPITACLNRLVSQWAASRNKGVFMDGVRLHRRVKLNERHWEKTGCFQSFFSCAEGRNVLRLTHKRRFSEGIRSFFWGKSEKGELKAFV